MQSFLLTTLVSLSSARVNGRDADREIPQRAHRGQPVSSLREADTISETTAEVREPARPKRQVLSTPWRSLPRPHTTRARVLTAVNERAAIELVPFSSRVIGQTFPAGRFRTGIRGPAAAGVDHR